MLVVATAGHVDHGKSTLVRALTGRDPDRLAAEKERGLTIDLGFTWGEFGPATIAFVDVPGHERFITTMLSGVGPVPAALLAVAADDPWMPQAAEHLAALSGLGVRHAVIALTRSDLAEPSAAADRVREEIAGTPLAGSPIIPVSAVTGAGLRELRAALTRLAIEVRSTGGAGGPGDVRLWIDRRFTITGSGTVVTGTLGAGTVHVGQELQSTPGTVRVRSVHALNIPHDHVTGTARVALNLTGASRSLQRGDPLWAPDAWHLSRVFDVRLTTGEGHLPRTPMLHLGSRSEQVRLRLLDDAHARVTLDHPLPLRQGDRGLLRDPGNRRVWGVRILDPDPPPLAGAGAGRARAAALLSRGTRPDLEAELTARGVMHTEALRRLGILTHGTPGWRTSEPWRERVTRDIAAAVREHDGAHPADPGLTPAEIAHALALPSPDLVADLLEAKMPSEGLRLEGGKVTSAGVRLPARVEAALTKLAEEAEGPFAAPTRNRLRELGLTDGDLGAAARLGRVFSPAPGVALQPSAPQQAEGLLRRLPQPFTTSEAREALGTSRRVAIPVLEFLDRAQVTRRLSDDRREIR